MPSVEKCDFTEDIQHGNGMLSGAASHGTQQPSSVFTSSSSPCTWAPAGRRKMRRRDSAGCPLLHPVLLIQLKSPSTLWSEPYVKRDLMLKKVLLCKVSLSPSKHRRASDWESSTSYSPKIIISPLILIFSSPKYITLQPSCCFYNFYYFVIWLGGLFCFGLVFFLMQVESLPKTHSEKKTWDFVTCYQEGSTERLVALSVLKIPSLFAESPSSQRPKAGAWGKVWEQESIKWYFL